MEAQHFARNILAAAVLSALGAYAAVAADFSKGFMKTEASSKNSRTSP